MDIENFTRKQLTKNNTIEEGSLEDKLANRIMEYKDIKYNDAIIMANSVIEEVENSLRIPHTEDNFIKELTTTHKADMDMGEMGVGTRGEGDFFIHRKIAEIIASTQISSISNPSDQDDGGVVRIPTTGENIYITTAIDGTHSRLSEYPFLGGFHACRATLRDIFMMGSEPIAIINNLHLADNGDVGKLFDYTAGVGTISELINVPIVAGSTLRVGGDMVLGDRLVSAVGAIGASPQLPTTRKKAEPGDTILLTEGSGGGTITTTAIYNNFPEIIKETININFIKASQALIQNNNILKDIHAMTDITNGGIRGDTHEITKTTGLGIELQEKTITKTINPQVLKMLEKLKIDPLGISTDSLMIITPPKTVKNIKKTINKAGVKISEIGKITQTGKTTIINTHGEKELLTPQFREAAYTPTKKTIGEKTPPKYTQMKKQAQKAIQKAIQKKNITKKKLTL
jgi:hydrogenase expression/formation protein